MANVSLDKGCRPTLEITIIGPKGEKTLTAVIDTGFDGFLSIPSSDLDDIGLPEPGPRFTARATLADNETKDVEVCLGSVRVGEQTEYGMFLIASRRGSAFLGIGFLMMFKMRFVLDIYDDVVELGPTNYKSQTGT